MQAAKDSGVKYILYTSIDRVNDSPDSPINFVLNSHLETEKAIKESGLGYTILRNNLYMDMLPWVLGTNVFDTGIFYPAAEGKIAYTMKSDMAEAIANVIMNDSLENKEYIISNSFAMSFNDVAEYLSTIAGKKINM